MNKDIIDNNKLIAEFMEFKPIDRRKRIDQVYITEKPFLGDPKLDWTAMSRDPDIDYDCSIPSSEMKFNTSWDWLMPVVQKILTLKLKEIVPSDLGISYARNKHYLSVNNLLDINVLFKNVVEFIKWYNYVEKNSKMVR